MLFSWAASVLFASAHAAPTFSRRQASVPPFFALAGDSTTAVQSTGGGGWGDGFLNTTLQDGAAGKNFGHNGATTASFRAGGDWARVLAAAGNASSQYNAFVTIQFGHNDQKNTSGVSIDQFQTNLIQFVADVRAVNATPILVTSLSRRSYSMVNGASRIVENLADVVNATKRVAVQVNCTIIDLNGASEAYLNAIGPDDAHSYNLNPTDNTHLNTQGSVVFGNLVAELLDAALPQVQDYVVPEPEIAAALDAGEYYFPADCEGTFCGSPA